MGHLEPIMLDAPSLAILETAYLLRPRTRSELVEALGKPERFDQRLAELAGAGFVHESSSGVLTFESPYAAFMALGRERARRIQEDTDRTNTMMAGLPRLIRAWDISEVDDGGQHPLAVSIIHDEGDEAGGASWFQHTAVERPRRPSVVLPTAVSLDAALTSGHLMALQALVPDGCVRTIVDGDLSLDGERATLVAGARAAGVEFRAGRDLPSWLYVDPATIVVVPVLWGSPTPHRCLAIRTPPVVAAMALLFDRLWDRAGGWGDDDAGWVRVLELLAGGMTDEAVAHALNLTPRTVRRRIAIAMDRLGATSRFELGMAWRERQTNRLG